MNLAQLKERAEVWRAWNRDSLMPALYQSEFGGPLDTLTLAALSAGALSTVPLPMTVGAGPMLTAGLSATGAALMAARVRREIENPSYLKSALGIRSALSPAGLTDPGLLMGYTTDTGLPIRVPLDSLMRHFLTGGMTGVGKTVSAITFMIQQVAMGGGVFWIDGKLDPDNILMLYHIAKWLGRESDFRVINPADPKNSNTYNFLLDGDADEVASRILSTVPSTEGNAGADYYKQAANQGLTSVIGAIKAIGHAYNSLDLSILLTSSKALLDLEKKCINLAPNHKATHLFRLFLEQFKVKTDKGMAIDIKKLKDVFGGVAGRLFVFGTGAMGDVTASYNPDVRLGRDIAANRIIYMALPTMAKQIAAQNFGKVGLGDLRSAVAEVQALPKHERPWPPFLVWMDEIASYGSAQALETQFQQARSAHIYLGAGYQENTSIEAIGPSFLGTMVGNTFSKLFFKPSNRETADCWADLIGKHKVAAKQFNRSFSGGTSAQRLRVSPDATASNSASISVMEKMDEEYRVSAEQLMKLDFGQAVMLYGAHKVYDLRVPKIDFSPNLRSELGPLKVIRPASASRKSSGGLTPLDYFERKDFLSESGLTEGDTAVNMASQTWGSASGARPGRSR